MWLEGRLGMDREKVKRVVSTFPTMLTLALDTMDWKIVWLQQRLNLSPEQLRGVIFKYPNLLAYSIEDNIEPTLTWLEEDLGLDAAVVGRLVVRQPRLLSANLDDNLKNKVLVHELKVSFDAETLRHVCHEILQNWCRGRNLDPPGNRFRWELLLRVSSASPWGV